ncbi:MAG: glycosyltransferase [Bacteriovorax sp.]|nr:glycosyltransferase [Bacteriovorax sp.]
MIIRPKLKTNSYRPVLVLAPGILAGAEKVVLTGINALYELGLNPLMIIIKETRAPHFANEFKKVLPEYIENITIDSTKALDIKLPYKLKDVLKNERLPIVLHSHGFKSLITCYIIKGKCPHLHTHHGNTAHTFKVRIYEKIAMMTMKTCSQVIAVSNKMNDELKTMLSPYKKIMVIENMLSLNNVAKIRKERSTQVQLNNNIIKLIYIGRLSPEKGLLPFLECLSKFHAKDRFFLMVLGDGVERPLVEKFILEHNLSSQVAIHGFVTDPSDFFISPDILIMPSQREGLPMTLIEALASGVPVIANNVGAISSLITHGHNGFLAVDHSIESWDKVLDTSIESYKDWKQNATLEAEAIEARFSTKLWAQKTQQIYQSNFN